MRKSHRRLLLEFHTDTDRYLKIEAADLSFLPGRGMFATRHGCDDTKDGDEHGDREDSDEAAVSNRFQPRQWGTPTQTGTNTLGHSSKKSATHL